MKIDFQSLQKALLSNTFLYCVVLLLILKIFSVGLLSNIPYNVFFADVTKATLERLANQTRTSLGLNPLKPSATLDKAAELKAEDMVKNQYFAHTSPQGATPWVWFKDAGYNYRYAGENLAIGFFDSIEVYNAWLNSPSHKENLLNPNYKEVGTAVLPGFGNSNTIVVVQLFGSLQPTKATAIKNTPIKPVAQPKPEGANPPMPASSGEARQVLSQSIEAQIQQSSGTEITNIYVKILNSIAYNYNRILQDVIFGFSLVFIGIMLTLILFSFNLHLEKKLVLRSFVIILLLITSLAIDSRVISALIPHQLII
jgi:uncharacterized protein YkwD